MNLYQNGFKTDFLNTTFNLNHKIWLKITSAYAIQTIGTMVIMILFLMAGGIYKQFQSLDKLQNPAEILDLYRNFGESLISSPLMIAFLVIIGVTVVLIASWLYNFSILLTDKQIKFDEVTFVEIFSKSFNNDVIRIFGAGLAIYLILVAGAFLAVLLASISGFLTFILFMGLFIFMIRFILVMPVMIIEQKSFSESVSFSFQKITWIRSLKIFGILILIFIILMIAAVVLAFVVGIFSLIPVLGSIIQIAFQIAFGGYIMALTISAMLGMYYRYIDDVEDNNNEIDINNLLVSE